MIEVLEKAIERIEQVRRNPSGNEAQIKQSVIIPILRGLGWDDSDPNEFKPEYYLQHSESGSVDYALCRENGKPVVFIEAKRLGQVSVQGEEQLFRYTNGQGVRLLILTDGNVWHFYLAMEEGPPADRRFYQVVLSENTEKKEECARHFEIYMRKERVYSGEAIEEAQTQLHGTHARKTAKENIPQAWKAVLDEPDPRLRDILYEAVEVKCGKKPHLDDLDNFLKEQTSPASATSEFKASQKTSSGLAVSPANSLGKAKARIKGYTLFGKTNELGKGRRTLEAILKDLDDRYPKFMQQFYRKLIERRNKWVVTQNPEKDWDGWKKDVVDLGNGWFFYQFQSTKNMIIYIKIACEVADIKYGSEDGLKINFN